MSPLPGPSFDVLKSPLGVGARVDIVRGRRTMALDVPVTGVQLDFNSEQTVQFQLTFTVPSEYVPSEPLDRLNNYGHRVHLWQVLESAGGTEHRIDLGWFVLTEWYGAGDVKVTAKGLLHLPDDDPMPLPSSPAKGATLKSEASRLAAPLPIIFDGDIDGAADRSWEWGKSRTDALQDLAQARGLEYGVQPDGYLHFWEPVHQRAIGRVYQCTDLLLDAPRKSKDRMANRFVAVGKGNVRTGWKNETVVNTAKSSGHSGWSVAQSKATLSFRAVSSVTRLRAQWELADGAAQSGFGLTLKKAMAKKGSFVITLGVTASRSMTLKYGRYKAGGLVSASSAAIGTSRTALTITVPDGASADGIRLFVDGSVADSQWLEVDSVSITKAGKAWYSSDFASKKKTGWVVIDGSITWEDSYSSASSSSSFTRAKLAHLSQGATAKIVPTYKKKVAEDGKITVTLVMRTNPVKACTVQAVNAAGGVVDSATVSSDDFTTVTLNVAAGKDLALVKIIPASFGAGGRVDIRSIKIVQAKAIMKEKSFTAVASTSAEPYGTDYGRKTEVVELESATAQSQVQDAANKALADALAAHEVRSVEIVPDATIRGGDMCGFVTETGERFSGRVKAFSLPVDDPDGKMRVDVEVLI